MAGKLCVILKSGKESPETANVAFTVANAAMASNQETMVFLMLEGTRLSQKGYADEIQEEGISSVKDLMEKFAAAGGKTFACSSCFTRRKLSESNLAGGVAVAGAAKLVDFLAGGAACVTL